jgi:Sporulation lipoprotein YhcN/YlaJ (Spore_YhcN_YlaJ)
MGTTREQQLDTRTRDVDNDGDRARLSGHNQLNNPPTRPEVSTHNAGLTPNSAQVPNDHNHFADRVAQLALSIPHVRGSVAVISGKTVILGLTIKKDLMRPQGLSVTDANVVKQELTHRIMQHAWYLNTVYVTMDKKQVLTITRIVDGLRAGHPLSTYQPQLHELMNGMSPVTWHK